MAADCRLTRTLMPRCHSLKSVDAKVGLCSTCRHATTQRSAKGTTFWRCLRADSDASLVRYPPLPVTRCHAYEGKPEG